MIPKVLAIIVTFHCEREALLRLLEALAPQITGGVIVNNSTYLPIPESTYRRLGFELLQMPANVGVASALNAGFSWAQQEQANFVITFDQDSEPAPDMVRCLMRAYKDLTGTGKKVAALGPQQVDSRTGLPSPFLAPSSVLRRKVFPTPGQSIEVEHLITSGCLMPMTAWQAGGKFLDKLFIDYVDIEWSMRMHHLGWRLFGVGGAFMLHTLGDEVHRLGRRHVLSHNPVRHYYMFRNAVLLYKLPFVPWVWKFSESMALIKRLIFHIVFVQARVIHLKFMFRGVRDGLLNRFGAPPNI